MALLALTFHFIPAIWSEEKGEEEKGGSKSYIFHHRDSYELASSK